MRKITIFLTIGALVLFMSGCGNSTGAYDDAATLPPDTASVSETASPDPAVSQLTDAPADTEPTDSSPTQGAEPSDDASTEPDQSADAGDDPSDESDQPEDEDSPAPTKTAKPSASPSADASSAGDESSGKALSVKKITGSAQVSEYLSLRSSASSSAKVLTKIQKDKKFTITGVSKDSDWLKVEYSGKSGYVLAKYVKVNGSSKNKVCMIISSGALNVRSGAGTTHKLLGTVKSGTTLVVTEVVKASPDNWYKVVLSGGTGYVNAKYCRIGS